MIYCTAIHNQSTMSNLQQHVKETWAGAVLNDVHL